MSAVVVTSVLYHCVVYGPRLRSISFLYCTYLEIFKNVLEMVVVSIVDGGAKLSVVHVLPARVCVRHRVVSPN